MIKSVKVTNYLNNSLTLVLTNPEQSGLAITNIEGLGPAKADIITTNMANNDGSIYNSARLNERNIVMTLRPVDSYTEVLSGGSTSGPIDRYDDIVEMDYSMFDKTWKKVFDGGES